MQEEPLRSAVVGLGNISGAHLRQYAQRSDTDLVAGADVRDEALRAAEDEYGLRGFGDWRAMLDDAKPHVVSICTPPVLHPEMTIECLQRGIHVLCEKPLAATVAGAQSMVAAAQEATAVLMPAFCHRFHPPILEIKALCEQGVLGRPLLFRCEFAGYSDQVGDHRADPAQAGGGALMDNGAHALDLFRFLLGDIANISARAGTRLQQMDTDDIGLALFEGQDGTYGQIAVAYSLPGPHCALEIIGSSATLRLDNYWSGPVRAWHRDTEAWTEHERAATGDRFAGEVQHFLDVSRGRVEPVVTPEDGLAVQLAVEAAYRSVAEESWVEVAST